MLRTVLLSIVMSLFIVHAAMAYVIQVCRQLSSRTRMELQFHPGPATIYKPVPPWSCYNLQTCMTYTIAECTVNKLLMTDRRTVRNM